MLSKKYSLLFVSMMASMALALVPACGDDDGGGGGGGTPDANTGGGTPDAGGGGGTPDAAPTSGLTDLGESCTPPGGAECQDNTNAKTCIQLQGLGNPFCSLQCGTDVMITANAMGQLPVPATGHQPCQDALTSTSGAGLCGIISGGSNPPPMSGPVAGDTYTVNLTCAIQCGAAAPMCPDGTTCQSGLCIP